jgi:hypothetical protein
MRSRVFTFTTAGSNVSKGDRLKRSAERWKWPLEVIRPDHSSTYLDFLKHKHLYIRDVLMETSASHFLFLDGWDTAFVGEEGVRLYPAALTFSAEKNCYPRGEWRKLYKTLDQPFPFLNSGVIWGPTSEYLRLCPDKPIHDQEAWTWEYLEKGRISLDTQASVALNLHSTKEEDLSRFPDGIRYNPTGTWPVILHGNGKWPLPNWLEV